MHVLVISWLGVVAVVATQMALQRRRQRKAPSDERVVREVRARFMTNALGAVLGSASPFIDGAEWEWLWWLLIVRIVSVAAAADLVLLGDEPVGVQLLFFVGYFLIVFSFAFAVWVTRALLAHGG